MQKTVRFMILSFVSIFLLIGCTSHPNITIEKIQEDIVGKNSGAGSMEWTFGESEPKDISIAESKYGGDKASIIIDMLTETKGFMSELMSGKLRLHYEWIAKEWILTSVENLTFKQASWKDILKKVQPNEKELKEIIQKHIKDNYSVVVPLGFINYKPNKFMLQAINFIEEEGLVEVDADKIRRTSGYFNVVLTENGKDMPHMIKDNKAFFLSGERKVNDIISLSGEKTVHDTFRIGGNKKILEVSFTFLSLRNDLNKKVTKNNYGESIKIPSDNKGLATFTYDLAEKKFSCTGYKYFWPINNKWQNLTWIDNENFIRFGNKKY